MQDGVRLDPGREERTVTAAGHSVASLGGPVRKMTAPVELVQSSEHPDVRSAGENGYVVLRSAVFLFGFGKQKRKHNNN